MSRRALTSGWMVTGRSEGVRRAAMLSDSAAMRWHANTAAAAAAACSRAEPARSDIQYRRQ